MPPSIQSPTRGRKTRINIIVKMTSAVPRSYELEDRSCITPRICEGTKSKGLRVDAYLGHKEDWAGLRLIQMLRRHQAREPRCYQAGVRQDIRVSDGRRTVHVVAVWAAQFRNGVSSVAVYEKIGEHKF